MLVLKVFVNHDQIDEVHIQNTGDVVDGNHAYKIVKPAGHIGLIYHDRTKGWKTLVEKALKVMR